MNLDHDYAAQPFASHVVVVTGSSRGIGLEIARAFAERGARVVLNGLDGEELEDAVDQLDAADQIIGVKADLATSAGVDSLISEAVKAFGSVDILINNAGWAAPRAHVLEMDDDFWTRVLQTNLSSVYRCTTRVANLMVDNQQRGAIVNISSFAASRSHRNMAAYDASKGGIESFTRAAALDLAPFRIRVNAVGPGDIRTERLGPRDDAEEARRAATVPLGRIGERSDIAKAVAFLASADADYITGQTLYVDGGVLAQLRSPQADSGLPPSIAARLSHPS